MEIVVRWASAWETIIKKVSDTSNFKKVSKFKVNRTFSNRFWFLKTFT